MTLQKYDTGATGTIWATQIAFGKDNEIALRICGTKGMLEWEHASAEVLKLTLEGHPTMIVSKGNGYAAIPLLSSSSRLPAGHHEGLYYAFANIYEEFISDVAGEEAGYYPTIREGYDLVHWLDCCWDSYQKHAWVSVSE